MELINQIGHIQHWGLTPACNILKFDQERHSKGQEPYRILLSGSSDIRHIMKTLSDQREGRPIHIYYHQTSKELLSRCLLFLIIIHEKSLNFEERTELFLDIYGNCMIKQRNSNYLQEIRNKILDFIHNDGQVNILKNIVDLKYMKYEERDQISQFVSSWSNFNIHTLREQKLRYLFKDRYDFKNNLIDWDYNMLMNTCSPITHFYHYKEWRLTGLAFEHRFSHYCAPNRTLASYATGRKKVEKTTCLVRGFWGDIVVSPYIAIGTLCDYEQKDLLYKKSNYKYIGHSVQISEYNIMYWLHKLQNNKEYVKIFRDYYRCNEQTKKQLESKEKDKKLKQQKKNKFKNKMKEIKQDQTEDIKQIEYIQKQQQSLQNKQYLTEMQGKMQQSYQKVQKEVQSERDNTIQQKRVIQSENNKKQDLDSQQQQQRKKTEQRDAQSVKTSKTGEVLYGFNKHGVKIYLMGMQSQNLIRQKHKQYFDMVVLGFSHSGYITKEIEKIVKVGGILLVQNGNYIVPKKKQQRQLLNQKIDEKIMEKKIFKKEKQDEVMLVYRKLQNK